MINKKEKLYLEMLFRLSEFENWWTYYLMTEGELHEKLCKESANNFIDCITKLNNNGYDVINDALNTEKEKESQDNSFFDNFLLKLSTWASSDMSIPYEEKLELSNIFLWIMFTNLKMLVLKEFDLIDIFKFVLSGDDLSYRLSSLQWRGHLPGRILDPNDFMEKASTKQSICVIGDIRRSQDLMTYSINESKFTEYMIEFLEGSMQRIKNHHGIFDKFTGDGFVAYFNENVCEEMDKDKNYIDCFIDFVKAEKEFAKQHFSNWEKYITKLPDKPIGLAMGADAGFIYFQMINNHFIATAKEIVWAQRMESTAEADQIVVNNQLHLLLDNVKDEKGIYLEEIEKATKTGEGFRARLMKFKNNRN